MTATQIEGAINNGLAILDDWNAFVAALLSIVGPDHAKFDPSAVIPGLTPPITIQGLGTKLAGTVALVQTLSDVQTTDLMPDATITDFIGRIAAIKATTERLVNSATTLDPENKVLSLDAEALVAANDAGQQLNVGPILAEL